jgi:hypothetical protein
MLLGQYLGYKLGFPLFAISDARFTESRLLTGLCPMKFNSKANRLANGVTLATTALLAVCLFFLYGLISLTH